MSLSARKHLGLVSLPFLHVRTVRRVGVEPTGGLSSRLGLSQLPKPFGYLRVVRDAGIGPAWSCLSSK